MVLRWHLWKGRLTPKRVTTHKLRTIALYRNCLQRDTAGQDSLDLSFQGGRGRAMAPWTWLLRKALACSLILSSGLCHRFPWVRLINSWRRNQRNLSVSWVFRTQGYHEKLGQHPKFYFLGDYGLRLETASGSWVCLLWFSLGMQVFSLGNRPKAAWNPLWKEASLTGSLHFLPIRRNRSPFICIHHILSHIQKPFNFSRNLNICYLAPKQQTVA